MRLVQDLFPCTIVEDDGNIGADGLTMNILADEELLIALTVDCARVGEAVMFHCFKNDGNNANAAIDTIIIE
jgi:hypothetical protein